MCVFQYSLAQLCLQSHHAGKSDIIRGPTLYILYDFPERDFNTSTCVVFIAAGWES